MIRITVAIKFWNYHRLSVGRSAASTAVSILDANIGVGHPVILNMRIFVIIVGCGAM